MHCKIYIYIYTFPGELAIISVALHFIRVKCFCVLKIYFSISILNSVHAPRGLLHAGGIYFGMLTVSYTQCLGNVR